MEIRNRWQTYLIILDPLWDIKPFIVYLENICRMQLGYPLLKSEMLLVQLTEKNHNKYVTFCVTHNKKQFRYVNLNSYCTILIAFKNLWHLSLLHWYDTYFTTDSRNRMKSKSPIQYDSMTIMILWSIRIMANAQENRFLTPIKGK